MNYADLFAFIEKAIADEIRTRETKARHHNLAFVSSNVSISQLSTSQKMELYRFLINVEHSQIVETDG